MYAWHFLDVLRCISISRGYQLADMSINFPDNRDVVIDHDLPELVGYNGVGFVCGDEDKPLELVPYPEFYDSLQEAVLEYIEENSDLRDEALKYLEIIKEKYHLSLCVSLSGSGGR